MTLWSFALLALLQSPPQAVVMDFDVRVPMRDGVSLSADIYRPAGAARVPIILVRTPYDNGTAAHVAAGKAWAAGDTPTSSRTSVAGENPTACSTRSSPKRTTATTRSSGWPGNRGRTGRWG